MGTKIRIANLPADADRYSIEDLLTMVGDVRTLRLENVDDVGVAKVIAYVEMADEHQAQDCISRFNKASFRGVTLSVREDVVFVPRPRAAPTRKIAKITKRKSVAR